MRNYTEEVTILDAKAATGIGTSFLVKDFRHVVVSINTAGNANLTVKAVGAISNTEPDFSAAQSVSNRYDFVQMRDYEDNTGIDGDTGFAAAGTDDHRLFEINTNGLVWLNFKVTARSAGSVTVKAVGFND